MCIAILNTKTELSRESLYNSYLNNNQGCGMLYVSEGKLQAFRTKNFEVFYSAYIKERQINKLPMVLHFRIATSGFSEINLHPFFVNEGLGFVHNGVISGLGSQKFSDTYEFNEILKGMPKKFLEIPAIVELIELAISSDKLVFLNKKGGYKIINEDYGHWDVKENWYSNTSYKQVNNYMFFGNTRVLKTDCKVDNWKSEDFKVKEYVSEIKKLQP